MKLVIFHLCGRFYEALAVRALARHKDMSDRARYFFTKIKG
jgi:hypothetical protein